MGSIHSQKELRRANLAALLDSYGQTKVHELTGIAAAYLYQMAKGKGSRKRGINDSNARLIELRLGKAEGWMDQDHKAIHATPAGPTHHPLPVMPTVVNAGIWPFSIPYFRFERLKKSQKKEIERNIEILIAGYEATNKPPVADQRKQKLK